MNATEAPWASRERTTAWLAFYISLFVFLSIAKAPAVLLATRFWAEEGTLFYPHLRPLGMLGALLFIYSGSLYLIPGLTVFAATKVPLLYAPAVTTYTAFLVELLTAGLICWFIVAYRIRPLAGLLLIAAWAFLPPTYETSATITNVHWTCAVSMLFVLLLPRDDLRRYFVPFAAWTLLCGLTGVSSCMLAPGFIVRAYFERSWPHAVLGLILGVCSLIQLWVLFSFGTSVRSFTTDPLILTLPALVHTAIIPYIGLAATETLIAPVREGTASGLHIFALYEIALVPLVLAVVLAVRSGWRTLAAFIAGLAVLVSLLNVFGSIGDTPRALISIHSARYYLFAAMCFCALLALGTTAKDKSRFIAIGLLGLLVCGSIVDGLRNNWESRASAVQPGRMKSRSASNCPVRW